jgi:ubiquinol-cytochrome c reductase cytochrome c1 subunit
MKKLILALVLPLATWWSLLVPAHAAGESLVPWDRFPMQRLTDQASLQNGARLFVNYCLNCHSAAFMRYNRMRDIGLSEEDIEANLIFTGARVGDTMRVSMDPADARDWFGGVPPDLTLIARSRASHSLGSGADYLYTYLRTYYRDESTTTGWNNLAFPGVGMPHVMWELQGDRRPIFEVVAGRGDAPVFTGRWETVSEGLMTPLEFDNAMADLVGFLQWMGEPAQNDRKRLGVFVLLFLAVFTIIAWRLNAAFWKDIK